MVPTTDPTRYEIVIEKNGISHHVCFTARKTKRSLVNGLFSVPQARGMEIFAELGGDMDFYWNTKTKEYVAENGARLCFSGKTERDIKNAA